MEIVQVVGIVFAAGVILVIAYLYRESALVEGKTEVSGGIRRRGHNSFWPRD